MDQIEALCGGKKCHDCIESKDLGLDFTMAFQPIVNCQTQKIYGYEALVRGLNGESAISVISQISERHLYFFDQLCRIKAIELASKLKLDGFLSVNFLPNGVYHSELSIKATLEAAKKYNFPIENIIFEFTEVEKILDYNYLRQAVESYKSLGFKTAIDDFGSGFSGLNLLVNFSTDMIKLDMDMIRNINSDRNRQVVVKSCLMMFKGLGAEPVAEGVETIEEFVWLRDAGVKLMQGYLFARPEVGVLPQVNFYTETVDGMYKNCYVG